MNTELYGESLHGNFKPSEEQALFDPHPYCIGPRHVEHAATNFSGQLGYVAIESAEAKGISCAHRGCNLPFKDHKRVLAVDCLQDFQDNPTAEGELKQWLLKIQSVLVSEDVVGVAFVKKF